MLKQIFGVGCVKTVIHFAACSIVEESIRQPEKYYKNNVAATLTLLHEMLRHGVPNLVFSSSASVYGEPKYVPIDEAHPVEPVNPYGASKYMVERMMDDFGKALGLRFVSLRYFNAAGSDPETELGECHELETHLIPNLLQAASGRKRGFTINGKNYPTPDGTCIRDYIHVVDLCHAHLCAMEYLMGHGENVFLNIGNGKGYSNLQVLEAVKTVTGRRFEVWESSGRPGDPAQLVADPTRARRVLKWTPQYDLEEIIRHAWAWECRVAKILTP